MCEKVLGQYKVQKKREEYFMYPSQKYFRKNTNPALLDECERLYMYTYFVTCNNVKIYIHIFD